MLLDLGRPFGQVLPVVYRESLGLRLLGEDLELPTEEAIRSGHEKSRSIFDAQRLRPRDHLRNILIGKNLAAK